VSCAAAPGSRAGRQGEGSGTHEGVVARLVERGGDLVVGQLALGADGDERLATVDDVDGDLVDALQGGELLGR
jgi:hypothetical protein